MRRQQTLQGFGILWGIITILASVPLWLTLPEPEGAQAITTAIVVRGDTGNDVSLTRLTRIGPAAG